MVSCRLSIARTPTAAFIGAQSLNKPAEYYDRRHRQCESSARLPYIIRVLPLRTTVVRDESDRS